MTKSEHAVCVAAALFGVLLAYNDAHSQTPTPIQPQPKAPYDEGQTVKPQPKPVQRVQQGSAVRPAPPQPNGVPCRYVPNGVNVTIACANGFWQTTTPEGLVYQGVTTPDPNADQPGSRIGINPATGGPTGFVYAPPPGQLQMLAPYQAQQYGYPLPD